MDQREQQLCDAYFRALLPREGDNATTDRAIAKIQLPPAPSEVWFWQRVAEEFNRWQVLVESRGT